MNILGVRCAGVLGFEDTTDPCKELATLRVTIQGTGSMAFDCHESPRCDRCARIDRRIVDKYYKAATFDSERLEATV